MDLIGKNGLLKNRQLFFNRIVSANDLIKSVNKGLTGVNFWFKDFSEVSQLLQQSIALIKHWETSCKQLTEIFWPNYSLNAWTGDAYVPQGLLDLINRLGEARLFNLITNYL